MSFTDYMENALLDHLFDAASSPASGISNWYVALSTTTPNDDGTNFTEPSGNGYDRAAINNGTGFNPASGGSIDNAAAVTFPQATGPWGTVTHFGIYDASSLGNLIATGALSSSQAVITNNVLTIPIGELVINLD